jgi:hypothetical protein
MTDPDEPCACPGPGFCPRWYMEMQQRPWELCRDRTELGAAYRRKWAEEGVTWKVCRSWCPGGKPWCWGVHLDGVAKKWGVAETEGEARAAAEAAARQLAAERGLPWPPQSGTGTAM